MWTIQQTRRSWGLCRWRRPNEYVAVTDIVVRGDLRVHRREVPTSPRQFEACGLSISRIPPSLRALSTTQLQPPPSISLSTSRSFTSQRPKESKFSTRPTFTDIRTLASYASAPVYTLDFDGSMLYAAATVRWTLHVIDVSDPTEPRPVSRIRPGYTVRYGESGKPPPVLHRFLCKRRADRLRYRQSGIPAAHRYERLRPKAVMG